MKHPHYGGPTAVLWRAMSSEELKGTISQKKPDFVRRFKWFSDCLQFVTDRVTDGHFNNSRMVPSRYQHIVEFKVLEADLRFFLRVGRSELMLDARQAHLLTWLHAAEICRRIT